MKFHLPFSCNNFAFDSDPRPEIIHILKKFIISLEVLDYFPVYIFANNGNRIGGCNLVLENEEVRENG